MKKYILLLIMIVIGTALVAGNIVDSKAKNETRLISGKVIDKISETYADVAEGEKLSLFNAAGYLEIAINKGNAAGLLGLQGFSEKQLQQSQYMNSRLFYQTVKVYFE